MPSINVELIKGVLPYTACVAIAMAAAGFIATPVRPSDAFKSERQVAAISSSSSLSEGPREIAHEAPHVGAGPFDQAAVSLVNHARKFTGCGQRREHDRAGKSDERAGRRLRLALQYARGRGLDGQRPS